MSGNRKRRRSRVSGNGALGAALREWRIDHDLTLEAAAKRLSRSKSTVHRWEKGAPMGARSRRQVERLIQKAAA